MARKPRSNKGSKRSAVYSSGNGRFQYHHTTVEKLAEDLFFAMHNLKLVRAMSELPNGRVYAAGHNRKFPDYYHFVRSTEDPSEAGFPAFLDSVLAQNKRGIFYSRVPNVFSPEYATQLDVQMKQEGGGDLADYLKQRATDRAMVGQSPILEKIVIVQPRLRVTLSRDLINNSSLSRHINEVSGEICCTLGSQEFIQKLEQRQIWFVADTVKKILNDYATAGSIPKVKLYD